MEEPLDLDSDIMIVFPPESENVLVESPPSINCKLMEDETTEGNPVACDSYPDTRTVVIEAYANACLTSTCLSAPRVGVRL